MVCRGRVNKNKIVESKKKDAVVPSLSFFATISLVLPVIETVMMFAITSVNEFVQIDSADKPGYVVE